MEALDRIEAALRERYNVATLDGVGPFADALAAARTGDLGSLRTAIAARDMYRWAPVIDEALAELSGEAPAAPAEPTPETAEASTEGATAEPSAPRRRTRSADVAEQPSPVEPTT